LLRKCNDGVNVQWQRLKVCTWTTRKW